MCLKIIKNTKDYFDQSLDEIRVLKLLQTSTPSVDSKFVLKLRDFFYYKEHLIIVTEFLKLNLWEFGKFTRGDDLTVPTPAAGERSGAKRSVNRCLEDVCCDAMRCVALRCVALRCVALRCVAARFAYGCG